jgi:hypothetical protein
VGEIAARKQKLETRKQVLHAIAISCVQSRQFFASTLREQLFELKNEDDILKSKNLGDTRACKGLSIKTIHGPIHTRETVPLSSTFFYSCHPNINRNVGFLKQYSLLYSFFAFAGFLFIVYILP